jgi:response regulator RpfG family c-di-GMP phosphodiesterase
MRWAHGSNKEAIQLAIEVLGHHHILYDGDGNPEFQRLKTNTSHTLGA